MARLRMEGIADDALVPTPPAGKATIFYNSTDRVYKVKLDDGSVAPIGSGGGGGGAWGSITGTLSAQTDLQNALNAKYDATNPDSFVNAAGAAAAAPVQSVAGQTGTITLSKSDVGLSNVDNTSDANKPISDATATALNDKYDASNPAGYVDAAEAAAAAPVQSVAGKTGAVLLTGADVGLSTTDNLIEGLTSLYYTDERVANSPAVLGIQNAISSIPTGTATSTAAATAASTTYVDVMSTTVTLNQTTTIYGVAMADLKATTAAAIAGFRVMINGVAGQTMSVNLADTTNNYPVLAQYFSATLGPGTYTVKAQMNRVSGTGTVNFTNGTLWSQAQQGAVVPVSPSRIYYVSKNGGTAPNYDGSWSRPFSTISAAVNAAIAAGADYNQPYAIAVAPGVGSTTYSETAPINVTKGGITIFAMNAPGYKGVQVALSGNFVVNMAGSNLFFALFGIEINCPATAAFTATPAALYVTGTATQRIFAESCVLNANSVSAGAVYCDNPLATIQIADSDVKAGNSTGPNVPPAKILAGNLILKGVEAFNRQSGNIGAVAELGGGSLTIFGGNYQGYINKTSNAANLQIFNGANIVSGSSPSLVLQSTASTGITLIYDAVLNSTASSVVTGGELFNCGTITYSNTGSGLDSALNSGAGPVFLAFDGRPKYYAADITQWAISAPANINDAINRLAAAVYAATGNTPIS